MTNISKKWLRVVGIGEDGWDDLTSEAKKLLYESDILLGGKRHLRMIPDHLKGERIVWSSPIKDAISTILTWRPNKDGTRRIVSVIASGDPLCYGIAAKLLKHLPIQEIWIKPSLSTFSLICSRIGWSLPDVDTLTIHGRPIEMIHSFVQSGAKLLVLSNDENSPQKVAELLKKRGFGKSIINVFEHLGGKNERRYNGEANSWSFPKGAALNAMAIECIPSSEAKILVTIPGLPDEAFLNDGQITKREVRAITLSRLMPVADHVLWDIGAGCGSISIEWMRVSPRCRAVAIEKSKTRTKLIEKNAFELGVPMLQIVTGIAPKVLKDLPAPDAIFIGGGLTSGAILQTCWKNLNPGGRLVSNVVTLEGEKVLLGWQSKYGGELTRLNISHVEQIGKFEGWKEVRSVTQLALVKKI
tara:strand:+ start:2128 stop:3369 length:1242 start_codon:yes stop_codon:yes gene_type:complete